MTKYAGTLFTATLISTSVWAGIASAQDYSAGKAPDGGTVSRGDVLGGSEATRAAAPDQRRSADAAARALPDIAARIKAFGVIKHSRDGSEVRMDAPPSVVDAIRGEQKTEMLPGGNSARDSAMEKGRDVIGDDNRVRVTDTTEFPYDTVGFVSSSHTASGKVFSCTGALIGKKVVVTAARCIYDHKLDGGWMDEVTFWPGINGADDVPYGSYKSDDAYVLDGFVSDYDGTYDSVWPYDVALIVLAEPAGDKLGWLGYGSLKDDEDVILKLIGYQSDKDDFTQWRSDCDVKADAIRKLDIVHECDSDGWSVGAPLYQSDSKADSRHVVGVNMDLLGEANWAVRFDEPILKWIDSVNE